MLAVFRRLVLIAALPLALTSCDLLAYAMYPDMLDSDFNPDFGESGEMSNYAQGAATIEIDGPTGTQTVTLNEVSSGSSFDGYGGAIVTWRNDDGWSLDLFAYEPGYGPSMPTGDVMLRWIHDSEVWAAGSYTSTSGRCEVSLGAMTADKLSGLASCTDLQWTDGANQFAYPPNAIDGEEPFDATITFDAAPGSPAGY